MANKEEDWKEITRKIIKYICLLETENKRQDKMKIKILSFMYQCLDNEKTFDKENENIKRTKRKR